MYTSESRNLDSEDKKKKIIFLKRNGEKQSIDSMQSLSSHQWYFSQN